MKTHFFLIPVFIAGVSIGWLGRTWFSPVPSGPAIGFTTDESASASRPGRNTLSESAPLAPQAQSEESFSIRSTNKPTTVSNPTGTTLSTDSRSVIDTYNQLLDSRQYFDAMVLYQEQFQNDKLTAARLKRLLIDRLQLLTESRNNSDFSELAESYLSIYYDDIDVLLLLAEFNRANGSFLEVINVYLLAKTYAYNDQDQNKVIGRFNEFVEQADRSYTSQQNWWSLINLYAHIDTSGLMTSTHQYRQALAYLRSGDKAFAIEQFNQLLSDSIVGDSAARALSNLAGSTTAGNELAESTGTLAIVGEPTLESADSIALKKIGNQYLIGLSNSQQHTVQLLIDTGASMTAMSSSAFNTLNTHGDAVAQERRVFHTAGGVIMGTVYVVPELQLGPYTINDTQIAVIDFDTGRGIDGLLGMNILGQFRFQIDQENARLLLSTEQ